VENRTAEKNPGNLKTGEQLPEGENNPTLTKVGDLVPAFEVRTLDGKMFNSRNLKGQVVFLNFFATWCPPCIAEMPGMEKEVWQKHQSGEFAFLSVGREETEEKIRGFARKFNLTFPMAADPKREVFRLFATQNIPRNYIINREGKIVFQSTGFQGDEFQQMLKILANELHTR
jgi:peroxiredoxin